MKNIQQMKKNQLIKSIQPFKNIEGFLDSCWQYFS